MNQPACQTNRRGHYAATGSIRPVARLFRAVPWRAGNTRRRAAATAAGLWLMVWGVSLAAGPATAGATTTENSPRVPRADAPEVTPEIAMACFSVVESWVRGWAEPAVEDVPVAAAAAVQGASITLRREGEIVGRGTVFRLDGDAGDHPLVAAARAAWREASDRMPGDRDALWLDRMRALAPDVTISLEVCGAAVTMSPLAYDDVDRMVAAGLDGVAVRMGSRVEAVFPAAMITRDMLPGDALASCVSVASGNAELGIRTNPVTQPPALARTHQAVFYRFRPLHVAQASVGGAGKFLHRSARVIPSREITSGQLAEWSARVADRLMSLAVEEAADVTDPPHPDAEGRICMRMPGTVFPATGKVDPEFAAARDQSIAAAALGRYGRSAGVLRTPQGARARNMAVRLLRGVLQHAPGGAPTVEIDQDWIGRGVAYRELLDDLTYEQTYNPWHTSRGSTAITVWDPAIKTNRLESPEDASPHKSLPMEDRGRLAYALALRQDPRAADHVRSLYRELGIGRLHEAMPWVGWADIEIARQAEGTPSTAMLREWRDAVYGKMIEMPAAGSDTADLAGGFVWDRALSTIPTSDSAWTVAFLATMLGDPRMTDVGERARELSRLLAALRFLRQLTADEFSCYSAKDAGRAMWGVRRSPCDLELRPVDSAMTLMAVREALGAIEGMKKKSE